MSDSHDLGLSHDLPVLLKRRGALALLGGVGLSAVLAACGGSGSASTGSSRATGASAAIPEETAGPFPGDGSNGVNALTSGIVRSDITASVGGASGVARGVPLDINLRVVDLSEGSAPFVGAAVYVWHCDGDGRYSLYDPAIANENYLRGVRAADSDGWVRFQSIYPGAYPGRWPHVHFEVYPSLDAATSAGTKLRTSQLARSPRPPAGRSTGRAATAAAWRALPRRRSRATWCSATATRSRWPTSRDRPTRG